MGTQFLNEGGVGRQIQYLVNGIDVEQYELHLALFCKKDLFFTDLLCSDRVTVHLLGRGRQIGPRTFVEMIGLGRRLRPRILHLWGGKANHLGGLASFFFAVPTVIFSVRSANNRFINHLLYRCLRARQSLTIVNSHGIRRELVEKAGYHDGEVTVMHDSLATEKFRPYGAEARKDARARLGVDGDLCLLASVGRISRQKNQLATLRALRELRAAGALPENVRLLFVGRPYELLYARRVDMARRAYGLEGICLIHEPVRDTSYLYNALDGIFQPSTYEGLSNVVIEAQACGTPVALSREGDNDGLVRDGETGISFTLGSEGGPARGLGALIDLCQNCDKRAAVTGAARAEVVQRFPLTRGIAGLKEIYGGILRQGGAVKRSHGRS